MIVHHIFSSEGDERPRDHDQDEPYPLFSVCEIARALRCDCCDVSQPSSGVTAYGTATPQVNWGHP